MSAKLELCGKNVPWESQDLDRCTASRLQTTCATLQESPLGYDSADIMGTLQSMKDAAEGIIRALNDPRNLAQEKLKPSQVKSELSTLSQDLQKTVRAIQAASVSEDGKKRWDSVDKPGIKQHVKPTKNFNEMLAYLSNMSHALNVCARGL